MSEFSYEVLGAAPPGERCTLCGKGGGVKRIKHRRAGHRCGEVDLWHPGCADRYFEDMADPPVKVPDLGPDPLDEHGAPRSTRPAATPAVSADSKYFAALQEEMGIRQSEDRQTKIGTIAVYTAGAALLSIVMLAVFFQWKSADAAKPQVVAGSSAHADRTDVFVPLPTKLNPPPTDITAAQNRLIALRFLNGPADGVGGPSRGRPYAHSRSQMVSRPTTSGTIS